MLTRRELLERIGGTALLGVAYPVSAAFAALATESRLVLVILRGGLDGLHAAPPLAEPEYRRLRPNLALPQPGTAGGIIELSAAWGLHPALALLKALYAEGELAILQAVGTGYSRRSHFDGQNVLENGTGRPFAARDGWLNRALAALEAPGGGRLGLAIGHAVPLVLRGGNAVRTWAPSRMPGVEAHFLDRLEPLYAADPLFARALAEARASAAGMADMARTGGGPRRARQPLSALAGAAGRLLAAPDGPRVAVLEVGGWDTHAGQTRRLARLLGDLADGLMALKIALGPAWRRTAVSVVSEFGRTVAENGSRGTDHGVGGIALLAGGAVAGGRILGRWPGLSAGALHEGRDVAPVNDVRALFKGLLHDHLGIAETVLEDTVFPASRHAPAMPRLLRRS